MWNLLQQYLQSKADGLPGPSVKEMIDAIPPPGPEHGGQRLESWSTDDGQVRV